MNTPRRKRYNRKVRLRVAAEWIKTVPTNHIKRYAKWYGVSRLCATQELMMLGVKLPEGSLDKEKKLEMEKMKANQLKKALRAQKEANDMNQHSEMFWCGYLGAEDYYNGIDFNDAVDDYIDLDDEKDNYFDFNDEEFDLDDIPF